MDWRLSASTGTKDQIYVSDKKLSKRREPQQSNSSFATAPTFPEFVSYLLATRVAKSHPPRRYIRVKNTFNGVKVDVTIFFI